VSNLETVQPIRDLNKIKEIKNILLGDQRNGRRNHLLFVLGINSGLRISDLLQLKYKDILDSNFNIKRVIIIKEKKTGKTKYFPINKSLTDAIKMYIEDLETINNNNFIFISKRNKKRPITRVQAWCILKNAAQKAGITEPIGTHSLRKTFGYHAYQTGVDITLLQNIFNHSAPDITLRYIGITQDEMNNVYINLNL
jgi:site-specific recombinase XerD